jgi:hypothetical protein
MAELTQPAVERRALVDLIMRGSNFSVSTIDGDHARMAIRTGASEILFDTSKLPELAAALTALHRAATGTEGR